MAAQPSAFVARLASAETLGMAAAGAAAALVAAGIALPGGLGAHAPGWARFAAVVLGGLRLAALFFFEHLRVDLALCPVGELLIHSLALVQHALHHLDDALLAQELAHRAGGPPGGDAVVEHLLDAGDERRVEHGGRPDVLQ